MEFGMSHRGEQAEIETFVGMSVDSELSGNMIDFCPVGALTSKPFRYSARTWELSRRKSISPHDSTGTNLIVQVKSNKVMRVLPLENEDINECWIADRDRFSYEALNTNERLVSPMLKQGGEWKTVDWQTALEYVANGLKQIREDHGASSLGALVSPHSTLEELYLAAALVRGLGSDNIDYRLRNAEFPPVESVRWLGASIASLSQLQRVLVVGSNLRKDHPLFAQRIRQAVRKGCAVSTINSAAELASPQAWAMPLAGTWVEESSAWVHMLSALAEAVAAQKGLALPSLLKQPNPAKWLSSETVVAMAESMAKSLMSGDRKAVLLGNSAAHHPHASSLLALANWIGQQTGAQVGYLTEAANTVGAQVAGAQPKGQGLNAGQMLQGQLKAVILLNSEPAFDSAAGPRAAAALAQAQMVVTLSPFKANMAFSDVLLPIAPFTETPGTFVNAEGRIQSFHAVVKPLGDTRPAWKVIRVLANLLNLPGFNFESSSEVLAEALGSGAEVWRQVPIEKLGNTTQHKTIDFSMSATPPVVASIYQLDSLVRRAPALQLTADARETRFIEEVAA